MAHIIKCLAFDENHFWPLLKSSISNGSMGKNRVKKFSCEIDIAKLLNCIGFLYKVLHKIGLFSVCAFTIFSV